MRTKSILKSFHVRKGKEEIESNGMTVVDRPTARTVCGINPNPVHKGIEQGDIRISCWKFIWYVQLEEIHCEVGTDLGQDSARMHQKT